MQDRRFSPGHQFGRPGLQLVDDAGKVVTGASFRFLFALHRTHTTPPSEALAHLLKVYRERHLQQGY